MHENHGVATGAGLEEFHPARRITSLKSSNLGDSVMVVGFPIFVRERDRKPGRASAVTIDGKVEIAKAGVAT
jgi:hypothetical protein